MAVTLALFDAADYLTTPEMRAIFLTEALKSSDSPYIAHALGAVARSHGMAKVARKCGLSRADLRRSLSDKGNPELATLLKVLQAVGLKLVAKPISKAARTPRAKSRARNKAA